MFETKRFLEVIRLGVAAPPFAADGSISAQVAVLPAGNCVQIRVLQFDLSSGVFGEQAPLLRVEASTIIRILPCTNDLFPAHNDPLSRVDLIPE